MAGGADDCGLDFTGLPVKVLACDYGASGLLLIEPPVAPLDRACAAASALVASYLETSQNGSFLTEELKEWRVVFRRS